MSASLRGLAACTALVMALALGWLWQTPRSLPSPQLLALRPAEIERLRWSRGGEVQLEVERRGAGWWVQRWRAPGGGALRPGGPARAAMLDDLLDVLAAARWQRRGAAARAGALGLELTLARRSGTQTIAVGQALGSQRWLVIDDQALLVDGWVVRVLEDVPAALPGGSRAGASSWGGAAAGTGLLDRSALPDAPRASALELHGAATSWRVAELVVQSGAVVTPDRWRLDPELWQRLGDALRALEVVPPAAPPPAGAAESPPGAAEDPAPRWTLRLLGGPAGEASIAGLGPCPDDSAASLVRSSRLGAGCIADAALAGAGALLDQLGAPTSLDRRPLAASAEELSELMIAGRAGASADVGARAAPPVRLRLWRDPGGRWRGELDGAPWALDESAVAEVLAQLGARWQPSAAPSPRELAIASLTARRRDGAPLELRLYPGAAAAPARLWRGREPMALAAPAPLQLAPAALAERLAERSAWTLDPVDVAALRLDGQRLARGAVLGEWRARDVGLPARAAAQLESLVGALAALRVERWQAVDGALPHRLDVELRGAPTRRRDGDAAPAQRPLQLQFERARRGAPCRGRVNGRGALLPAALCALVRQLAA